MEILIVWTISHTGY